MRLFAIACGFLMGHGAVAQENTSLVGTVTSVIDGDTIKVQVPTGPVIVRLAHIDAPEAYQPHGRAAARALHARLLAQEVSLQVVGRQGEDRAVAVLRLGDENVNAWMVKQGHAWALRAASLDANYCAWEDAARSLRRGLWSAPEWVAPWDWRVARKDAQFFPTDYSSASTASCMRELRDAPIQDD
jgi:endonuclease YncB( thermonuclease family)